MREPDFQNALETWDHESPAVVHEDEPTDPDPPRRMRLPLPEMESVDAVALRKAA